VSRPDVGLAKDLTARALVLLAVVVAGTAGAQPPAHAHGGPPLGSVDFPVSCSAAAQAEFPRAVALLHHMTYPQAREAFQRVAETDPGCAMAHWGIAMTLFQPLWPTRPGPEELRRGWEAVEKASTLGAPTARERLFIAATEAFFRDPESADYWPRIHRWEQAMERLHAAQPEDPEATAFYALAHLAAAPPGDGSLAHSRRAAELLLTVYADHPDHPGAMHYLVHANDAPGRERESLEITRRYEAIAPRNPHALHMPTHIYTRLGDWPAVIRGNLRAAEAALEHPAGERGELVWDEFPHAIEYLVYAYLQQGEDGLAAAQLERLRATDHLEPSFKTAFHLSSIAARHALERRAWHEAAALSPRQPPHLPWDRFPWPEAVSWFAYGLGSVHLGEAAEAARSRHRLEELEAAAAERGEELFARQIRILRLELSAWLAHLAGDHPASEAGMRQAAELELTTPKHAVTPAPTLPGFELLGDLLLAQERPAPALAAYRRSLELYPRRLNSLLGAYRAARAAGDPTAAGAYCRELVEMAGETATRAALREAGSCRGALPERASPASPEYTGGT
jgi:tetratricopeptide (TPR) repeat protein